MLLLLFGPACGVRYGNHVTMLGYPWLLFGPVEIKLSTNGKVIAGYTRQLKTYKTGEQTTKGFYVVIDVGQMGEKAKRLIAEKNAASTALV